MKLYITSQDHKLETHLKNLLKSPVMQYDKKSLPEKITAIKINSEKSLKELDVAFLYDYKIFPQHIMTYKTQWCLEKRNVQVGDTIVQQVFLPPTKVLSQKIIFGVRINSIIHEPGRKGFSYETLEGHVEKGESTFTIEETDEGLIFKIQTFSQPGNLLSKLLGPIFSLPYQRYCTKQALENVKRQVTLIV
jgi:uncharacterized protein (UPF0548 family)